VLQLMLDMCRRSRELEVIDARDGEVRARGGVSGGGLWAALRRVFPSRRLLSCGVVCALRRAAADGACGARCGAQGDEMTALMMAAANGHEACVRELLYAGARATHASANNAQPRLLSRFLAPSPLRALIRRAHRLPRAASRPLPSQAPSRRWCASRV
jgi:hypothetical protein